MELWALCSWDHSTVVPRFHACHLLPCRCEKCPWWYLLHFLLHRVRKESNLALLPSTALLRRKTLVPRGQRAWACKKSWGKKAELCLPSPFPAALRKEGNRCHPFQTSMSVTSTAWIKPDVISRAVRPDTSQTALKAVQWSLRFPSHLLNFLKWRPQAHSSEFS